MNSFVLLVAVLNLGIVGASAFAEEGPPVTTSTPVRDVVTLKDGSVIYGEVIEMTGGLLHLKNSMVSDIIKIKWEQISKLAVSHPIPFHLKDGTILIGTVEESDPDMIKLKAGPTGSIMTLPMDTVTQVNPVVQPAVIYTGSLNAGYSQATGNSQLLNISVLGDLVARSEQLRLTLLGRYVYGDDAGSILTRNARGTIKLDFFLTKRLFLYASAFFENDRLQRLRLRTSLSSGAGYQWIERGDSDGLFKDATFYTEAGPAYFNEDFLDPIPDQASFRGRVAMKLNWPLFDDRITLYHYDEIFPSLQTFSDFYFTMDNGVRLKILGGLTSGFQVTTRYNNRPPAGTTDTDNLYLLTLGYALDTTRKR